MPFRCHEVASREVAGGRQCADPCRFQEPTARRRADCRSFSSTRAPTALLRGSRPKHAPPWSLHRSWFQRCTYHNSRNLTAQEAPLHGLFVFIAGRQSPPALTAVDRALSSAHRGPREQTPGPLARACRGSAARSSGTVSRTSARSAARCDSAPARQCIARATWLVKPRPIPIMATERSLGTLPKTRRVPERECGTSCPAQRDRGVGDFMR